MWIKIKRFLKLLFGLRKCVWEIKLYDENGNEIYSTYYDVTCDLVEVNSYAVNLIFKNKNACRVNVEFKREEDV